MKAFISEYGKVIVVAIIIMALLGVANFFADDGTEKFKDMLNSYVSTANGESSSASPEDSDDPAGKETPTLTLSKNSVRVSVVASGSEIPGMTTDTVTIEANVTIETNSDGEITVSPQESEGHLWADANIEGSTITFSPSAVATGEHTYIWIVTIAETEAYAEQTAEIEVTTYIDPNAFSSQF